MINNTDRLLSTILLGNNLVNVAFTALVTALAVSWLGEGPLALTAATGIGTAVLLIFGEIIPKSIAVKKSEKMTFLYARPLKTVEYSLYPLILFLQWLSRATQTIFGREATDEDRVTEGELRMLIDMGRQEGAVEEDEAKLLEQVFNFGDKQIREVMTPRPQIKAIQSGTTLEEFLTLFAADSHTRFPVCQDHPENIIGTLTTKDIMMSFGRHEIAEDTDITTLAKQPFFVPETKTISTTFREMQQSRHGLVYAINEFGGLAGLATAKQLLEVLVGDMPDTAEESLPKPDSELYELVGQTLISEMQSELNLRLPEGDYQTLAGFILATLGHVPESGTTLIQDDMKLIVLQASDTRIELVQVERLPNANIA
jgi:CBS domain containing-hemolysin-like protein